MRFHEDGIEIPRSRKLYCVIDQPLSDALTLIVCMHIQSMDLQTAQISRQLQGIVIESQNSRECVVLIAKSVELAFDLV